MAREPSNDDSTPLGDGSTAPGDDSVAPGDFASADETGMEAGLVLKHGRQTAASIKKMKVAAGSFVPPMADPKTLSKTPFAERLRKDALAKKGG
jgi:hypothetical protein